MNATLEIYLKLFGCAMISVVLSAAVYLLKRLTPFGKIREDIKQIIIGILFGVVAILGTELGVDIGGAVANARDAAPICAGLIFGGPAGIIAGVIGAAWRWAAAAWGAGMYSRVACTVSTALAGLYAALLRRYVFEGRRPTVVLSFVTGGVMEIVHLTILFLTHLTAPEQAFEIVKICTFPMVICNAVSVALAALAVSAISSGIHKREKKFASISQRFQIPMLIVVLLAFLVSTAFVYMLQTYNGQQTATQLMELNIKDVKQEILDASDRHLLTVTHDIADRIEERREEGQPLALHDLAEEYGVTDIYLVDEKGIVADSAGAHIGYDMNSDAGKPEEERQSSRFMVLLTDECDEYVQEYMPLADDQMVMKKLAGVSLPQGGFVQAGYGGNGFQKEISTQVRDITNNRRIGETGRLIIVDGNNMVVSGDAKEDTEIVKASLVADYGKKDERAKKIKVSSGSFFSLTDETEGYRIVAIMPEEEVYRTRDAVAIINTFLEIIIFAALFIEVYLIIRRVVVNRLREINAGLRRITGGDLDTQIDEHSTEEFASLSGSINSTVEALKKYISEAESRIDKELEFARSIQHSALPSVFPPYPDRKEFDIFATMDTAKQVGGDFYDFYMLDSTHIAFLVADVSGKGIPAAMFMMTAKTTIKSLAETGIPVNEIFTRANEKLCEGNDADMFVTAWMGILNTETGHVEFANAGHNPPLIYRNGQGWEYLRSRAGLVLAGMEGMKYRVQETDLRKGDRIYLYTDGVTEATDTEEKLYGEERLRAFLNSRCGDGCQEILRGVRGDVDSFVGEAEQFDDITMLVIEYRGKAENFEYRQFPSDDAVLGDVQSFLSGEMEKMGASPADIMRAEVAVEEIFVNIAHYAYGRDKGPVLVGFAAAENEAVIEFRDKGIPFNPFGKEDPDITLSAEERQIGGLGIFMTKKIMDSYYYESRDGYNIVTLRKKI